MKEPNWKIVFTSQILLIILVSSILSFKMGLFKDIKQQFVKEAVAEEPLKQNINNTTIVKKDTTKVIQPVKEVLAKNVENPKKELVEKASVLENVSVVNEVPEIFERKTDAEVKKIMDKYNKQINDSFITTATSYNSESGQTDDTPCITASNLNVCERNTEDIVATNDLPFHTKILIPEYFGDRIFYVEDRMNQRYTGTDHVDIWMKNKANSKSFGAKVLKIIVLK